MFCRWVADFFPPPTLIITIWSYMCSQALSRIMLGIILVLGKKAIHLSFPGQFFSSGFFTDIKLKLIYSENNGSWNILYSRTNRHTIPAKSVISLGWEWVQGLILEECWAKVKIAIIENKWCHKNKNPILIVAYWEFWSHTQTCFSDSEFLWYEALILGIPFPSCPISSIGRYLDPVV